MLARRVLLCHESGDARDAGARLGTLAHAFAEAGWNVQWAGCGPWPGSSSVTPTTCWPTPRPWPQQLRRFSEKPLPLVSRASCLLAEGWSDVEYLHALLQGWFQALTASRPDWVVTDGAAAAQLAARCLWLPVLQTGDDALFQQLAQPMPALRWWLREAHAHTAVRHDQLLTQSVSAALARLGVERRIDTAADIWTAHLRLVASSAWLLPPEGSPDGLSWLALDAEADAGDVRHATEAGLDDVLWSGPATHPAVCRALALRQAMLLFPADIEQWLRARRLQEAGLAVVVAPSDDAERREQRQTQALDLAAALAGRFPEPPPSPPCVSAAQVVARCAAPGA